MWINITLVMLGTVCLTIAIGQLFKERHCQAIQFYLLLLGICVFLWCGGYGLMGMTEDFRQALIYRNVGLCGIIAFLLIETYFFIFVSKVIHTKLRTVIYSVTGSIGVADFILFSRQNVLHFLRANDRTCYYANATFARSFHYGFICIIFAFLCALGIFWYLNCTLKREKRLISCMCFINFVMLFCAIPDTFTPLLQSPSAPSSAYGSTLTYLLIYYMGMQFNAFSISIGNLNKYIYQYVEFPVLLLDITNKIIEMNDYAESFFRIEKFQAHHLSQLFELSQSQKLDLLSAINGDQKKNIHLLTCNGQKACSISATTIRDQYGDIYCTICFVADITRESQRMEELNELKEKLTRELKEKTKKLDQFTFQSIGTIANAIDAKDGYTKGHSIRVAEYSALIAKCMGWSDEQVQNLKYIGLLHDIGKIGMPDALLKKTDKLTDSEYQLFQSHTLVGGQILKDNAMIENVAQGALYHHERYDGKGYPVGLSGEQIPIIARIICVADAFDAMNSTRVYRTQLPPERIRMELVNGRGTQFDPQVVDIALSLLDEQQLKATNPSLTQADAVTEESNLLMQRFFS